MHTNLLDHGWKTIGDNNELAEGFIIDKLAQLKSIKEEITKTQGAEQARYYMHEGLIEHALTRCLRHKRGEGGIDADDYTIFFEYASIMSKELIAHLEAVDD
jgi:hypothetical protein